MREQQRPGSREGEDVEAQASDRSLSTYWRARAHAVYPGLLAAVTIELSSTFLSDHYGAPVMLFALLTGIAFHFLYEEGRCIAGIEFASQTVLRIGVALLGARITFDQIASLGPIPVAMVAAEVCTTVLTGVIVARALNLNATLGVLTGGAVAICGVAAALALASVLPRTTQSECDTAVVVVTVTAFSTIAMIAYPVLARALDLTDEQAGLFLGGTIHDVAQVVGAGYMMSPQTGDTATYVKMLRVATLLPLVFAIVIVTARQPVDGASRPRAVFPWFLVAFAALVSITSTGVLPSGVVHAASDVSRWCLVAAIAAIGMKTSFKTLVGVGWLPIVLLVAETAWIAGLVLAVAIWLG